MEETLEMQPQLARKPGLRDLLPRMPGIFRRLLTAWLVAALVLYYRLPEHLRDLQGLEGLETMSFPMLLLVTLGIFVGLMLLGNRLWSEKAERWLLVGAYGGLLYLAVEANRLQPFFRGGLLVLGMMVVYGIFGWNQKETKGLPKGRLEGSYAVAAVLVSLWFFSFVRDWNVSRYLSFSNSTFDFGIFAQAFHYLRTTLIPFTTVERDGLLSHFAVHVSPILYTILPVYALYPDPATLQVLQAALMASAAIPVWKLGKEYRFPGLLRLLFCLVLFLYPAYAGGTSYDFHENCFLTPLLLWLFYAIERKCNWQVALFTVLTLMVKEDAAVYVVVTGLWLVAQGLVKPLFQRWNRMTGGAMILGGLVWFTLATGYLGTQGDGVMTWRYSNFLYGGSESLTTAVKAVLMSPMKALFECMDEEKLEYINLTLLPLAGLPLLTRRYERLILLIPYILLNLLSDYVYQHDIFFQYSFGSVAFMVLLSMMNARDIREAGKENLCQILVLTAVVLGAMYFGEHIRPKAEYYVDLYETYEDRYEERARILEEIPDYVPVAATTFLAPHLSQRDVLYDIHYCTPEQMLSAEYILIDPGISGCLRQYETPEKSGYQGITELLAQEGFVLVEKLDTVLEIYKKP